MLLKVLVGTEKQGLAQSTGSISRSCFDLKVQKKALCCSQIPLISTALLSELKNSKRSISHINAEEKQQIHWTCSGDLIKLTLETTCLQPGRQATNIKVDTIAGPDKRGLLCGLPTRTPVASGHCPAPTVKGGICQLSHIPPRSHILFSGPYSMYLEPKFLCLSGPDL